MNWPPVSPVKMGLEGMHLMSIQKQERKIVSKRVWKRVLHFLCRVFTGSKVWPYLTAWIVTALRRGCSLEDTQIRNSHVFSRTVGHRERIFIPKIFNIHILVLLAPASDSVTKAYVHKVIFLRKRSDSHAECLLLIFSFCIRADLLQSPYILPFLSNHKGFTLLIAAQLNVQFQHYNIY